MGLISKKFTQEQEKELQRLVEKLEDICIPCVQAWKKFMQDMYELMSICQPARLSEADPLGINKLIEPALESAIKYRDSLSDAESRFTALPVRDWFPKKLKNEMGTWGLFFKGQLSPLSMVIQSLNPPDPLKMRAKEGGAKLNMFVSGMNMIAMARHLNVVADN
jgi:hypothetical protein